MIWLGLIAFLVPLGWFGFQVFLAATADRRAITRRRQRPTPPIADQIRKLEKEMGIGPFAGKEKWCEPTEPCGHRDHGPIDEETGLWEPDYSPRPSRFLFAENPETIVAKQYVMGQLPDVPDVLDFKIKEKTPDELTLAEALGDHSVTYARGFAETPSPRVDPSELTLAEAEKLVRSGHMPMSMLAEMRGYGPTTSPPCHDPYHDHHEIRSLRGAVRRSCVPRL